MAKKTTRKKTSTRSVSSKKEVEDEIPSRVTNKRILEKLLEIEKRQIRMEKLILLLVDDNFFKRDEQARVQRIEQMVQEGRIDELQELMKENVI